MLKYTEEWRRVVGRLGRWVDFDNDYKTMDPTFMESVWWVFKTLWDKGLVYNRFGDALQLAIIHRFIELRSPWTTGCSRSSDHVMPLVDQADCALLIWTTTPWTLPSNLAIAVGNEIEYVRASQKDDDAQYIVARERLTGFGCRCNDT